MTVLLLIALAVAVVVIVILLIRRAVYRSTHGYTESDIASARRDSLARSRNVVSGKVQEHLVPFFPEFLGMFNPRDARFLGSPIDFIVFSGLDDGEECREVVLVEVKTGKSPLSKRERHVRDAVEAGRVSYRLIRLSPPRENGLAAEAEIAGAHPQADHRQISE
jgi:predicted Holliday junction resolvase-like endonuclease